jgi:hypothetical protein
MAEDPLPVGRFTTVADDGRDYGAQQATVVYGVPNGLFGFGPLVDKCQWYETIENDRATCGPTGLQPAPPSHQRIYAHRWHQGSCSARCGIVT